MALRLRPVRRRRRATLRLSISMVALPLLGLLALIQAASLRSPLSETEAPLAIAARYPTRRLVATATPHTSAAATAVASVGSNVVGTTEFRLRALGVVVGCAALGLLVWLGERLYSTRTGVVAGAILIATPAGRSLLGTDFGIEPFHLLLLIIALGAIRNLAVDKRSLVRAGMAGGAAIALVGLGATWIPLMALAWLRRLRGLGWRSFAITLGTTFGTAAVLALACAFVLGVAPLPRLALPPAAASARAFGATLGQMIPFLPLVLLGLWNRPRRWLSEGSPRFLTLWTLLSAGAMLFFGSFAALWVAVAMVLGVVSTWALDRAPRTHSATALAACVALGLALGSFDLSPAEFDVDRWAVRETGKFLRRNVDSGSTIAAPEAARSRLTYYATRPIEPLDPQATELAGLDYVVLDRREMEGAPTSAEDDAWPPRELRFHGHRLQVIAEFGSWMLARVEPA